MKAVRILTNGKVKTGHRTVKVTKRLEEAVLFVAKGQGGSWKVVFDKPDGNPFTPASINVPKGSLQSSGPPSASAVVGKAIATASMTEPVSSRTIPTSTSSSQG